MYGVVSSVVTDRTDEIGIRLALGATRDGVLRRELASGGKTIVLGVVLGLALALVGSRLLTSMLFEISPADPAVVLATGGTLLVVALSAIVLPALRASRIDPIQAIRSAD